MSPVLLQFYLLIYFKITSVLTFQTQNELIVSGSFTDNQDETESTDFFLVTIPAQGKKKGKKYRISTEWFWEYEPKIEQIIIIKNY